MGGQYPKCPASGSDRKKGLFILLEIGDPTFDEISALGPGECNLGSNGSSLGGELWCGAAA